MTKVLFVNHNNVGCGTYQFMARIYNLVRDSKNVHYIQINVETWEEYALAVVNYKPDYVLINYHWDRMPWLTSSNLIDGRDTFKNYFIFHDGSVLENYDKYLFFGDYDPDRMAIPEDRKILLPRPLMEYSGAYYKNLIPTIGSFGFSTPHKRFPELVKLVNNTFEEAHIRLHLAETYFGDNFGYSVKDTVKACNLANTNPNVKLTITNNFVDDTTLLKFLARNDINVFYYDIINNPGLSSATDYALSVRRPIAVTKNMTFRHIASDDILMEKNTLQEIMARGTEPLKKFYDMWSPDKFMSDMDRLFI